MSEPKQPVIPARMRILAAIDAYTCRNGRPPLVREIGIDTGMDDVRLSDHLAALHAFGYIERATRLRSTRLTLTGRYTLEHYREMEGDPDGKPE